MEFIYPRALHSDPNTLARRPLTYEQHKCGTEKVAVSKTSQALEQDSHFWIKQEKWLTLRRFTITARHATSLLLASVLRYDKSSVFSGAALENPPQCN